jgi:DNA-binding transcriptional MerR regulator
MTAEKIIPKHLEGREFLSKKAGSFSGVSQRNVQFWTEQGIISPDIENTTGTGNRRKYSTLNCIEIGIASSLAKNRIHLDLIKDCLKYLRSEKIFGSGLQLDRWYQLVKNPDGSNPILVIYYTDTDDPKKPLEYEIELSRVAGVVRSEYDKTLIVNIARIAEKVVSKIDG